MAITLVAFDKHQIDGRDPRKQRVKRWFVCPTQFLHDCDACARSKYDFFGTRDTVTVTVFSSVIHIKSVMRVFDAGDGKAAVGEFCDQPFHKACFARIFPTCNAVNFHG
jgi:hypothetical protein